MVQSSDKKHAKNGGSLISRRASVNWIMLVYFASGACSLIDEVVWVRLLKLTLGNTVYATSIVVSVFMGGLALGALVMSRYCDRVRARLRLYALLETLVTISALSLPWLLKLADPVYVWFYRRYHPSHGQLLVVQVLMSAAILLLPSMLMGSTLPLLGRFVTALEKECGHLVGRLYALNTLGAAVGCFLAGFVLIRRFGVMGTLYIAAALNLLVAFGGWLLSRFSGITDEENEVAPAPKSRRAPAVERTDGRFYVLVLAFFMSGLISIGYELLWMRSIVPLVGGFTYVFSAVLTVYLLGNVIGAGIGSRLAPRLKIPAGGFAVTLFVLGLSGIFYLPLLVFWTSGALLHVHRLLNRICSWFSVSPFTVGPLVQSVFLFLAPTIIMGIGFPIALQAWAKHVHKVGRSTGTAYGANTIGAVAGGAVTGFVLIPWLGVQTSISLLGLLGVWIAGVMWYLFTARSRMVGRCTVLAATILLTVLTVKMPPRLFDVLLKISPIIPEGQLLWVEEGVTTTVSLHRNWADGTLQLCSSGQPVAGEGYIARGDQKMLGHFGVLLNRHAKQVLSVGFGAGETTACLADHNLEKVDCVEIAPEVVKVALKFFRHLNLRDRLDREVNMIFMDAKNYLHLTDSSYDVIVNDSIHPRDFAENASLYAKEYFESAKKRLNENGIIMSWLPTYDMPYSAFKSIIGTLMEVFPYVTIWYPTAHPAPLVLIIGSDKQQYFSPEHIENEMLKPGVRESLSGIDMHSSVHVLSCYIADQQDLQEVIRGFSTNSDYWPFVEFTTDMAAPERQIFTDFIMNVRGDSIYRHIDWSGFAQEEKEKWLQNFRLIFEASRHLFMSISSSVTLDRFRHCVDGLRVLPDYPALLRTRLDVEGQLYAEAVTMVESGDTEKALDLAGDMLKVDPNSVAAWVVTAHARQAKGDMEAALAAARQAAQIAPNDPQAHLHIGLALHDMGRYDEAITEYKKMLRLAEQTGQVGSYKLAQMLEPIAAAYTAAGRFDEAVAAAERALELARASGQQKMVEHMQWRLRSIKTQQAAQKGRQ